MVVLNLRYLPSPAALAGKHVNLALKKEVWARDRERVGGGDCIWKLTAHRLHLKPRD